MKLTAERLGYKLKDNLEICEHCAKANIKKKKIAKEIKDKKEMIGERIAIDITGCKKKQALEEINTPM